MVRPITQNFTKPEIIQPCVNICLNCFEYRLIQMKTMRYPGGVKMKYKLSQSNRELSVVLVGGGGGDQNIHTQICNTKTHKINIEGLTNLPVTQ